MLKSRVLQNIIDISDDKNRDYEDFIRQLDFLKKAVEEYPEVSEYAASAMAQIVADTNFDTKLTYRAAETFSAVAENLPEDKALNCIDNIMKKNESFAFSLLPQAFLRYPKAVEMFFPKLLKYNEAPQHASLWQSLLPRKKTPPADNKQYAIALTEAVCAASDTQAKKMLEQIFADTSNPLPRQELYGKLGYIYSKHPHLGDAVFHYLTEADNTLPDFYNKLYCNLLQISYAAPEERNRVQKLLKQYVVHPQNTAQELNSLFIKIGHILAECPPEQKKEWEEIIKTGLNNPVNTIISKKNAWRALEDEEKLRSSFSLGQRVEKNSQHPHGWKDDAVINPQETSILVLGGDGADTPQKVNSYLSDISELLKKNQLEQKVFLYGAVYDFGDYMDTATARTEMMEKYRHKRTVRRNLHEDTAHPRYIDEIFTKIFLPRICSADGERLPAEEAAANIRRLNIVAHCHGAYTALKLEEAMQQKMKELGYTPEERTKIQQQLLVMAMAPYCPLGEAKSTFLSFISLQDKDVPHYNNFEKAMLHIQRNEEIPLSFLPGKRGNCFLIHSLGEKMSDQHNFWGFTPSSSMNKEGVDFVSLSGNILINAVKKSLETPQSSLSIKELAAASAQTKKFFEEICANGEALYQKISAYNIAHYKQAAAKFRL